MTSARSASMRRRSASRSRAVWTAASNAWSSMGFSMKSTAPALNAARVAAMSPWAVTRITGSRTANSASLFCSASPLIPGMRMSRTRQPPHSGRQAARKSSAEAKVSVRWPFSSRSSDSESRTASSSSTMNTFTSFGFTGFMACGY